ncbi:MAG: hypothetical protein R6V85_07330 [Polyangia bacterium]
MSRVKTVSIVVSLLLALVAACGGKGPSKIAAPELPPVDENLGDLAPAGVVGALWIDVEQLRGSVLWEAIPILESALQADEMRRITGVDPLEVVDELLIVVDDAGEDSGEALALLKGSFSSDEVLASISRAGEGVPIDIGEAPGLRTEEFVLAAITDRTIALGDENTARAAVELAAGSGEPLSSDPKLKHLGSSGAAIEAVLRRGVSAPAFTRFEGGGLPFDALDRATDFEITVDAGEGLCIEAAVTAETKLDAAGLARDFTELADRLAQNGFALLLGVDWLVEKIEISHDGSRVLARLQLAETDVVQLRRLFERLDKIRRLGEQSDSAPELGPPPDISIPTLEQPLRLKPDDSAAPPAEKSE